MATVMMDQVLIHQLDPKQPDMVMKVVGATPEGHIVTEYIHHPEWGQFANWPHYLHSPQTYGLRI